MITMSLAVNGFCENANAVTSERYEMEQIVVTATREETPQRDVAANVEVVTRQDLQNMPADNAAEALQYIPGVFVDFEGGPGSQASATIQGAETRQVAVYQDGVPLNMLANPKTDLAGLPVDAIERIEVYKGAASSAWGSALGGVINIVTREPETEKPVSGQIQGSYGEAETVKARGHITGRIDNFGYLLSMTRNESDGFIDHRAYRQEAAYAKFDWYLGDASRLNFVYSHTDTDREDPVLNAFDFGDEDFWDDIEQERTYQRLMFETMPAADLRLVIEGRHHVYDEFIEDVYTNERVVYNDYEEETWGASARVHYGGFSRHQLNAGFDGDWGRYDWIWYEKDYETGTWAVYANDTVRLGNWTVNAGIRNDHDREFGDEISPSAGLVRHLFEDRALLRFQAAKGFSAPPASWVHDPTYGNPDLEPETAVNYQVGTTIRLLPFLEVEVDAFYAEVDDLINYSPDTERWKNIDAATRQGVEAAITADFDFGLNLRVSGSYTDVEDEETGETIEDIPRTQYQAAAVYTWRWLTQSLYGNYIDHNSSYPETDDRVFIFDYKVRAQLPDVLPHGRAALYGVVYNLFNSHYIYRKVYPQPGRWVEGGLVYQF